MNEVTIHHLPVEIMMAALSDAIEYHLVGVSEQYYILPNDGVRFYLRLSCVCRRWRDIIFSMATLWRSSGSFLWTAKPERVAARAREAIQKLTLWYGRAGQLPLNISLTMPRCNTDGGPELCALNEYVVAIDRWEEVTYTANAPLITSLLDMANRRRENSPFARLRSLTMSLSWNDNQKLGPLSTFAQTFASLTELNLRLVLWDSNTFLAQLHFPSLTSLMLSLDRMPIGDVLLKQYILPVLLTQNPTLQHLHLCHRFSTTHEGPTTNITHSSLRSLEVEGHLIIEQFGLLTLPNLACLKINNQYNSDTHAASHGSAFVQSILDMIERSSCTLTEFWTTSIRLLNSELVRLLTAMPTLRKLRMASWDHWPKYGRAIDDPGEVEAPDDMECDAPPKGGHFLTELYNRSLATEDGHNMAVLPCLNSLELKSRRDEWTNAQLNAFLLFVHDPRRIWDIGKFELVGVRETDEGGYPDEDGDGNEGGDGGQVEGKGGEHDESEADTKVRERYAFLETVVLQNASTSKLGRHYWKAQGEWWVRHPWKAYPHKFRRREPGGRSVALNPRGMPKSVGPQSC